MAEYIPTKYDSVFWVEVDKIKPNPYQPRLEFDEMRLKALADSIRQYGVLQPLVVTRSDVERPDGGLGSEYELIAGERRLRAAKLVGLLTVPVVIRSGESNLTKLELAIIENLQREDLNAVDRARALAKLIDEFGISHAAVGAKIGKSREYVSNSIRLLTLPEPMQQAIVDREITEGHARALLALNDRPQERETLFREIVLKKLPVRAAERIARSIAQERVRSYHRKSPEMAELEKSLTETLGTRVIIEPNEQGGRLMIDFFSPDDLSTLVTALAERVSSQPDAGAAEPTIPHAPNTTQVEPPIFPNTTQADVIAAPAPEEEGDLSRAESREDDLYSVKNFVV